MNKILILSSLLFASLASAELRRTPKFGPGFNFDGGGEAGLDYDQVRHLYWAFHSSKYWTMDWPVEETMID